MPVRPPLEEATLRETKDDLTSCIVKQAAVTPDVVRDGLGVDPTSINSIESYVGTVVRKAEVRHEEHRRKDPLHTPSPTAPDLRPGNQFISEDVGSFEFKHREHGLFQVDGPRRRLLPVEGPNTRAARLCFAEMRELALQSGDTTWSRQIDLIGKQDVPMAFKDKALKNVLRLYVEKYGDPRLKPERPVSIPVRSSRNPFVRVGPRQDWRAAAPSLFDMVYGR